MLIFLADLTFNTFLYVIYHQEFLNPVESYPQLCVLRQKLWEPADTPNHAIEVAQGRDCLSQVKSPSKPDI